MVKIKKADDFLKLLKKYWYNHSNLTFGAMLDQLMSLEGNVKDISHIEDQEWIQWFENQLKEPKGFTKDKLKSLRINRFKEYHSLSQSNKLYAREPIPLFIDGKFNKNNYFGGDDLIRAFFTEISESNEPIMFPEVAINYDGIDYNISYTAHEMESEQYIIFNIAFTGMKFTPESSEHVFDIAVFGFDKTDIDKVDFCWFSGKEMTEEDYIFVLNVIQESGFNFFEKKIDENTDESKLLEQNDE